MRKILYLLLALGLTFSCKSKKSNRTEHKEEQRSERKETKDSSIQVEKSQKVSTFDLQHSQSYELTLESDSVGNAKEVVYHRIRDGDSETIRVINGRVTLKTIDNLSKSLQQADTTLYIDNKISQKSETKNIYTEHKKEVQKEVKTIPIALIISTLIIGVFALLLWRFKLFR
ncbi:hypothetical protein [Capnocytophaga gingivalis]|jgi:hypothetical protein|uniref:Lipoprotein n=1 Tax=Capnocytophaga gingivalis TaxID=1017 RepID=A0ABU5YCG5_9FLAO|nr:hypothetical protein [Capnocytophaga gingivalis]MEB3041658.1 hypothetical protein [Capnocytophaga gingivalis]